MIIILYFIITFLIIVNIRLFNLENFDDRHENLDLIPKIFLKEAKKLNLKYSILNFNPSKLKLFNSKKNVIITPMSYTFNNIKYVRIARNKFKTYKLLIQYQEDILNMNMDHLK